MFPIKDLTPKNDVKGGSPKTPSPMPLSEYQQVVPRHNGSMAGWIVATGIGGMLAGTLLAWFTALLSKGVTQKDLEDYVDKHSPYLGDKGILFEHNREHDEAIGVIKGKQERVIDRMTVMETIQTEQTRDLQDCKKEMGIVADYIDGERKLKK